MGDILIRAHHDQTSLVAINSAHLKNVASSLLIDAKHLLVVLQPELALIWLEKRRHVFVGKLIEGLLEHSAEVDETVDVFIFSRELHDR